MLLKRETKVGDIFHRLTVLAVRAEFKGGCYRHLCRCECGNEKMIGASNLELGKSKSCGCLSRETTSKRATTHGMSKRDEYQVWNRMWNRCTNPKIERYPQYGGRGISVCDEWKSFESFYADMGDKPSPSHSIGRIDNNGNYCKANCRWETAKEQGANTSRSIFIEIDGVRLSVPEWADKLGMNQDVIRQRVHAGVSPGKLLAKENLKEKVITVDGVSKLTTEWMKCLAIPISSFYYLSRKGLSREDIVRKYQDSMRGAA
ncbi:hypothetical protein [Pseudomonas sp.]|uniref:hypothetical protein n=1 Tax=Pseudomonas sp. TaxID=306 RepID=UPI003266D82E